MVLRPEDIAVQIAPGAAMAANLSGKVAEIGYQGDSCRAQRRVGGEAIKVKIAPHLALALPPWIGDRIVLGAAMPLVC